MQQKLITDGAIMLVATTAASKPGDDFGLSTLAKLGTVDEGFQAYNVAIWSK
jgi:hypothetical protein